jgi:hypothetical protein
LQAATAVYGGMRNVVTLLGDERLIEVPEGFSRRLYRRFASSVSLPTECMTSHSVLRGWQTSSSLSETINTSTERRRSLGQFHLEQTLPEGSYKISENLRSNADDG